MIQFLKIKIIPFLILPIFFGGIHIPQIVCASEVPEDRDPISIALEKKIRSGYRISKKTLHSRPALKRFYKERGYRLAWTNSSLTHALVQVISRAPEEGLNPEIYYLSAVRDLMNRSQKEGGGTKGNASSIDLDLLLSNAFLTYASHLLHGVVNPLNRRRINFKESEGFDLANYLQKAIQLRNISGSLYSLLPRDSRYSTFKRNLVRFQQKKREGPLPMVPMGKKLVKGDRSQRVGVLRDRLIAEDYLKFSTSEADLFDDKLETALKKFQKRHGLEPDGVAGVATLRALRESIKKKSCKIKANMDRWRAWSKMMNDRYVMVNIPAFRLRVIDKGSQIMDMKVIAGRRDRKSPILIDEATHIILSPFWHVPRSIAVKDKLSKIQKDPSFLTRHGMKIYENDAYGAVQLDPHSIKWEEVTADNFSYHIVQNPGRGNALGRIKFMFPNRHSVYMHDTPKKHLFKRFPRSFSSGCVRIEKPIEMAKFLLRENPEWNEEKIKEGMNSGRRRQVDLERTIPVYLTYFTSWIDENGQIQFFDDIYNYDWVYKNSLCREGKKG